MNAQHFDIIIIGTGAGGGTLAYKLAPTGKKILILERGSYNPREKNNWSTQAVFLDAKYKAKEQWLDKNGKKFHPGIHYCVGGNTKVYGAALLRMREKDFGALHHHGGISPAWPATDLYKNYIDKGKAINKRVFHLVYERSNYSGEINAYEKDHLKKQALDLAKELLHLSREFNRCAESKYQITIKKVIEKALEESDEAARFYGMINPLRPDPPK